MSQSKPLAYQSSKAVLEYISFGKRKHLYAICPAIRKMEEILPYHLEIVRLETMSQENIMMMIDSFSLSFFEIYESKMSMRYNSTRAKCVSWLTNLGPEQAVEKFVLYHFSREGTRIKEFLISKAPEFISKCAPIAIKELYVDRTPAWFPTNIPIEYVAVDTTVREDTLKMAKHVTVEIPSYANKRINTEIVSEWNCESIIIESSMSSEEIADYCNKVSKRTDRPIGSRLDANHSSPVEPLFDLLHSKMNARKAMLNDRKCATISIDESTELNVYGDGMFNPYVIVEVCARGTAIDV
ncbi:hypothetical protein GCK72_020914 [Caenorhabditis remanei]|uniref:DUF38 domain-containing protein n=1 Tax=Caenorhabditis remanei TaxID=31234 RepID=A0A6A5GHU8_CAERE|nr:hypothetical protein GCK72_020914 [Caenorhabditis remanei]KAF1754354.1 hypothetical protein GCK72_020914 [Caenorhabditis remanei]